MARDIHTLYTDHCVYVVDIMYRIPHLLHCFCLAASALICCPISRCTRICYQISRCTHTCCHISRCTHICRQISRCVSPGIAWQVQSCRDDTRMPGSVRHTLCGNMHTSYLRRQMSGSVRHTLCGNMHTSYLRRLTLGSVSHILSRNMHTSYLNVRQRPPYTLREHAHELP